MSEKDIFLLIDASGLIYRSFFALPPLTSPAGRPTGALFGFIRSFLKVNTKLSPAHLIAVFDGPENKKSRLALYSDYKATRKPTPNELIEQIEEAKKFCTLFGIPMLAERGVEADDTIASITEWAVRETPSTIFLCSADKDLAQLVSKQVRIINPAKEDKILDEAGVEEEWGLRPDQMCDYFALIGDASDNVPGIEGIGPKTAVALLKEWKTLDGLLANVDAIPGKKGEHIKAGRESALLSKQLVVLDRSVKVPHTIQFYERQEPHTQELYHFFQEKGFKTLEPLLSTPLPPDVPPPCQHEIITTKEDLDRLISWLEKKSTIAIDCETTRLDEFSAELVGIGLASEPTHVFYIDCRTKLSGEEVVKRLNTVIKKNGIRLIGHNIKYDLHVLTRFGLEVPKLDFDTLLASWLLYAHERNHNLDDLARRHFHKEKIPIESLIGKGKQTRSMAEAPVPAVAAYCAEDVEFTLRLKELFEQELKETHIDRVFRNVEMPLIPVLLRMENNGVYVNVDRLHAIQTIIDHSLEEVQAAIYTMAGKTFNINSPKQLSDVLFVDLKLPKQGKGKLHLSTNIEVMEELSLFHPIAQKIIEYRQLDKLKSTYLETLPKQIRADSGRVHCRFAQSGTATGRMACQDPNLQNIPVKSELGKEIRSAFQPQQPGWVYVSADYSQIELRLLAHISKDPTLIKAFTEEMDIHALTAAEIFGVSLSQVTDDMRRRAKAVNFGILYGQQAYGLARELHISTKEAQEFINRYFARYSTVQGVIAEAKAKAHRTGMAETLTGRRRLIPDINSSDFFIRAANERLAVNTPFQGTSADIIKMAMIAIDHALVHDAMRTMMVLQIHDELLFEAPEEELERLLPLIKEKMENVMSLAVPLRVDINVGKNWKEC